jgi:hypothetical protein
MEELAVSPLCLIGDDEDALAAVLSVTWPVREGGARRERGHLHELLDDLLGI